MKQDVITYWARFVSDFIQNALLVSAVFKGEYTTLAIAATLIAVVIRLAADIKDWLRNT